MATKITANKIYYNKVNPNNELINFTGSVAVSYGGGSGGLLLTFYATKATTVTIKGGSGVFGGVDKVFTLGAEKNTQLLLEPGPYLQTEGAEKGCVLVQASECLIGATELN